MWWMNFFRARIVYQVVSAGRVQMMLAVIFALRQNLGMKQSINRDDLPEMKIFLSDLVKKATAPHPLKTRDGELLVKRLPLKLLAIEYS